MSDQPKNGPVPMPANRRARRAAASFVRRGKVPAGTRVAVVPGEGKDLTREGDSGGASMNPNAGIKGHGAK